MSEITPVLYFLQTHPLSVVLALVVSYIIGSIWHGPLFGQMWMKLNALKQPKKEDMKFSMMAPGLIANFVMIVVQTAVLGRAFQIVALGGIGDALTLAAIVWLPFTALVICNTYAWLGKSWKLMLLDCAYNLVSLWAVALVLYYTM